MTLSIIVAVSKNNIIGMRDQLPWRLSSDLKRFKRLTMGHHLIMGRRTYESIGRALPGRTTIVISRQANYLAEDCLVAGDFEEAIRIATSDDEVFVVGGSQIYELALPRCDHLYWTEVDTEVAGDTYFPSVNWDQWRLVSEETYPRDDRNEFASRFRVYDRSWSTTISRNEQEPEPTWDVALLYPSQGDWTEDEYLTLTDSTSRMVEFVNGRIEVLEMPTEAHQLIVKYLSFALDGFVMPRGLGTVLFAPLRIRTRPGKFREPDVLLMLSDNKDRRDNRYWNGADLVMEVVSDDPISRDRDLTIKRLEYAQAGILEYWIIDPAENRIIVLRLQGNDYVVHGAFTVGQQATSTLLDGFCIDVTNLLSASSV